MQCVPSSYSDKRSPHIHVFSVPVLGGGRVGGWGANKQIIFTEGHHVPPTLPLSTAAYLLWIQPGAGESAITTICNV